MAYGPREGERQRPGWGTRGDRWERKQVEAVGVEQTEAERGGGSGQDLGVGLIELQSWREGQLEGVQQGSLGSQLSGRLAALWSSPRTRVKTSPMPLSCSPTLSPGASFLGERSSSPRWWTLSASCSGR